MVIGSVGLFHLPAVSAVHRLGTGTAASLLWFLVDALFLFAAGYIAGCSTRSAKLTASFVVGAVLALLVLVPAADMWRLGSVPLGIVLQWVGRLLLAPLAGGYVAKRHGSEECVERLRKVIRIVAWNEVLFAGFLLVGGAVSVRSVIKEDLDLLLITILSGSAALGTVFVAWAVLSLRRIVGIRRGVLLNPFVYLSILYAAVCASVLPYRARNRHRTVTEPMREAVKAFNARVSMPEGLDGYFLYDVLLSGIPSKAQCPKGLLASGVWADDERPEWAKWLDANQELLSRAVETLRRAPTQCHLRIVERDHPFVEDPVPARRLGQMLCAQGRRLAAKDEMPGALVHLDASYRLGTLLSCGLPAWKLLGMVCRTEAVRSFRDILLNTDIRHADLLLAQKTLQQWLPLAAPDPESFRRCVDVEVAEEQSYLFDETSLQEGNIALHLIMLLLPVDAIASETRASLARVYAAETPRELIARSKELSAETHSALSPATSATTLDHVLKIHTQSTAGYVHRIVEKLLAAQARAAILRAYVAVRLFEMDTGALPTDWEALVPMYLAAPPSDPFSEAALLLDADDQALRIWSVSADGVDNGGNGVLFDSDQQDSSTPSLAEGTDIVLSVERRQP